MDDFDAITNTINFNSSSDSDSVTSDWCLVPLENIETAQLQVKKSCNKKRKLEDNPRAYLYLPRIPRKDIRRQYASMFSNVYNSQDVTFMRSFLETFFRQDVTVIFSKHDQSQQMLKEAECQGMDICGNLWSHSWKDAEDMLFQLQKTQIKLRTDGTGVVSSTFLMSGTRVLSTLTQKKTFFDVDECVTLVEQAAEITRQTTFDQEFNQALNEYLHEDSNSSNVASPAIPDSLLEGKETKSGNRKILDMSNLSSTFQEMTCPVEELKQLGFSDKPEQAQEPVLETSNQVVALPFATTGHFTLHFDMDSKVYLVTFSMQEQPFQAAAAAQFYPPQVVNTPIASY